MVLKKKRLSSRKEPNQDRAVSTVDAILTATTHILDTKGFEETSTNKIAEKAGVSIGSLYQYFPNKESIIAMMLERHINKQAAKLEARVADLTTANLEETIRALLKVVFEEKRNSPKINRILAQRFAALNQLDVMIKTDDYLVEVFKRNIKPYEAEIRMENLDMSLYLVVQMAKLLPISLLFSKRYTIEDEAVFEECVQLIYRFLKK
ncbi:MAG: TetR/AcrR family transcriptional regulator [Bacteriovoracaceae bacterium]|nr:TetR/AcrR family transcriptional regulator [Bacteriovoracaceae bacterium]